MTNHELNEKVAELLGWKWKGVALKGVSGQVVLSSEVLDRCYFEKTQFSPATSIKDAMGLLKTMQGDEWRAVFNSVLVAEADIDTFARAITEGFVAATETAK